MNIIPGVILGGPVANERAPEDFCALMAGTGIEGVEVGTGQKRTTTDPEELEAYLQRWDRALKTNGLRCSSLNCSLQPDQREDIAVIFRAAAERGVQIVKVDVSPYEVRDAYEPLMAQARENWTALVPVAQEFGVKAVAEIHPRIVCHSPSAMRRMLDGLDPEAVGAILDPGNMVVEGWEDMHEAVDILGPYLAHLHVKNGAWRPRTGGLPPWESFGTALDAGMVDWFEVCRELARVGYQGWGILEFLHPVMNNRQWIEKDVQTLLAATQAAYGW